MISENFDLFGSDLGEHHVTISVNRKNEGIGFCKLTADAIISRFIDVHGNRYRYSMVVYAGWSVDVLIYCNTCKDYFLQTPGAHINSSGCKRCSFKKKIETNADVFVKKAKAKYGDKYCYKNTVYKGSKINVDIFCNICKVSFQKTPSCHLSGSGCVSCRSDFSKKNISKKNISKKNISKKNIRKPKYDTNSFIKKAQEVHGDKFCYNKTEYKNSFEKISIFCKTCKSTFQKTPNGHLRSGCRVCSIKVKVMDTNSFIKKAKLVHGDDYSYCKSKYIKNTLKISISCKKCKLNFKQSPNSHLNGHGCPYCAESKGERRVRRYLTGKIYFEVQKCFKKHKGVSTFRFDFFIPSMSICIEYQGRQHYGSVRNNFFGGEAAFIKLQQRDQIKKEFCKKNNIKLLEIHHKDFEKIESILEKELKITKKNNEGL